MDLTNVHDHPAVLLKKVATKLDDTGHPAEADAAESASIYLRGIEAQHKVTFAALDNDALAEVQSIRASIEKVSMADLDGLYLQLERALDGLLGEVEA